MNRRGGALLGKRVEYSSYCLLLLMYLPFDTGGFLLGDFHTRVGCFVDILTEVLTKFFRIAILTLICAMKIFVKRHSTYNPSISRGTSNLETDVHRSKSPIT
ncbi:hypothetical protein AVEN_106239-1 [Araneus ventricosus]|uniref:Uncharacterized protein n=1 Tax=Araneus ventricosus TaxID=182803 RepID=A0A4Y2HI94_ARAVE|nr:hypothetical protein AVEN_106239-1 [Araneus ventricosus]